MAIRKSVEEINEKIRRGEAVVVTAEEVAEMAKDLSPKEIAERVDVVTTGTFGPMCSSGAFMNFGHATPKIRMEKIILNGVEAHAGLAAVDAYIGATQVSVEDPSYGGAHVIEAFIKGEDILLVASGKGTDCYPRKFIRTFINKETVNEAYLFNPRNAYQNYVVAVNTSDRVIYTYMGKLLPNLGNATYATSGELSPLINDPELRTIGIGTRIFLGGTEGYVVWQGTQFNRSVEKNERGIPIEGAATLAVIGDLKKMSTEYVRAAYFTNYGVTLFVGIGIPIPILDEDLAYRVSVRNEEIDVVIRDYSRVERPILGKTNFAELLSGEITIQGKRVKVSPITSLSTSRKIAQELKRWIKEGRFPLSAPVATFPEDAIFKPLKVREKPRGVYKPAGVAKDVDDTKLVRVNGLNFNLEECVSCGICTGICDTGAFSFNGNRKVVFNPEKCNGCGICMDACPMGVIFEAAEKKTA